jgi:hypothetical protein
MTRRQQNHYTMEMRLWEEQKFGSICASSVPPLAAAVYALCMIGHVCDRGSRVPGHKEKGGAKYGTALLFQLPSCYCPVLT